MSEKPVWEIDDLHRWERHRDLRDEINETVSQGGHLLSAGLAIGLGVSGFALLFLGHWVVASIIGVSGALIAYFPDYLGRVRFVRGLSPRKVWAWMHQSPEVGVQMVAPLVRLSVGFVYFAAVAWALSSPIGSIILAGLAVVVAAPTVYMMLFCHRDYVRSIVKQHVDIVRTSRLGGQSD